MQDLTSFSEFGIGDGEGSSLPITLLSFDAKYLANKAATHLTWATAIEINNDYFHIERSFDGVNFELVAEVDGAGNSTSEIKYETYDENPPLGLIYYRLKQVDFDGTVTYSELVSVVVSSVRNTSVKLYPNPTKNFVHLIVETESKNISVILMNINGAVIGMYEAENPGGTINLDLSLDDSLPSGEYFVRVSTDTEAMIEKLIIID